MEDYFGPITPVLLIGMIAGIVELAKRFGLSGNGPLALSVGLGVLFGVLHQLMILYPGVFSTWVQVGIYGVLFGLATSGLWVLTRNMACRIGAAITDAGCK